MTTMLEVRNVSKRFVYWEDRPRSLKVALVDMFRGRLNVGQRRTIEVLKNISFNIQAGEFVGLMGQNGVGKSTLLRLIGGIYMPSEGSITVRGTVAPLTAIGAGFHEELSGYENIYLNAAILGFGRKQIQQKIADILSFAELGKLINMPVKSYSNGMLLRLGFSVAVFLDAPIILLDEVLAVGDIGFQEKCLNKIRQLHQEGRTILLVSHSPEEIERHCSRCLVLGPQGVLFDGPPAKGAQIYSAVCTKT